MGGIRRHKVALVLSCSLPRDWPQINTNQSPLLLPKPRHSPSPQVGKRREDDGAGAAKCGAIGREMIGISVSECFCA